MKNLKPLRTEEDHRAALGELQVLWGASRVLPVAIV
jgi:hypothetical protein